MIFSSPISVIPPSFPPPFSYSSPILVKFPLHFQIPPPFRSNCCDHYGRKSLFPRPWGRNGFWISYHYNGGGKTSMHHHKNERLLVVRSPGPSDTHIHIFISLSFRRFPPSIKAQILRCFGSMVVSEDSKGNVPDHKRGQESPERGGPTLTGHGLQS